MTYNADKLIAINNIDDERPVWPKMGNKLMRATRGRKLVPACMLVPASTLVPAREVRTSLYTALTAPLSITALHVALMLSSKNMTAPI